MRVIAPPSGLLKPFAWPLDPLRTEAPELWRDGFHIPLMEGAGAPFAAPGRASISRLGSPVAPWTPTTRGIGLDLDPPSNNGLSIANADLPAWYPGKAGQAYTVLALILPENNAITRNIIVKGSGGGGDADRPFLCFLDDANKVAANVNTTMPSLVGATAVAANAIHLVGSRWDGNGRLDVLLDGKQDGTTTGISSISTNAAAVRYGIRWDNAGGLEGRLIAVYNWGRYQPDSVIEAIWGDPNAPFRLRRRRWGAFAPAGAGPTEKAASDSATLSEAASVVESNTVAASDTATLSEAAAVAQAVSASDAATFSESSAEAVTETAVSDIVLTESAVTIAAALTAADSATLAESADNSAALSAVDAASASESASAENLGDVIVASDSGSLSEAAATSATLAAAEAAALAEAATLAVSLAAADSAALTELADAGEPEAKAGAELFSLSEVAVVALGGGALAPIEITLAGQKLVTITLRGEHAGD